MGHIQPGLDRESGSATSVSTSVMLEKAARRTPDHLALVERNLGGRGRTWTYQELDQHVTQVARRLSERHGVGARLVIWVPNSVEWVLVALGAMRAGIIIVPANPAFTATELDYIVEQSEADALVYVPEHFGVSRKQVVDDAARKHGLSSVISTETVNEWLGSVADEAALPTVHGDDQAMILYSSGTTGFPKGALLRHEGLITAARQMHERMGFGEQRAPVWLNVMPYFHVGGCGTAMLGPISLGGVQVVLPRFDAAAVLDTIAEEHINGLLAVPTMMVALLEEQEARPRDTGSLVGVLSGGTNLSPDLVSRFQEKFDCYVLNSYGQTEAHGALTATAPGDAASETQTGVGFPFPGVELQVRDTASGAPLPEGQDGEICFRGIQLMNGYFNRPSETREVFTADGWQRTGDVGRIDSDGRLHITARLKEMLIRGGENVYPREIESILAVTVGEDVAVVGVPDPTWGEEVGAVMALPVGSDASEAVATALNNCVDSLAPYKVPRYWFIVRDLPRTASGKIHKVELVRSMAEGQLTPMFHTSSVRGREVVPLKGTHQIR